jgi:EmrB/QacA subfamily drug resistance transporter
VLAFMLGGSMLAVLNGNMISVTLPTVMADFQIDLAQLTWVLAAQTLTFSATMPIWGRLGDMHGAKRMFLLGLTIFTVGSILCAFSATYLQLILCRVVQSVGAAGLLPNSLAIINRTFPAHRRGRAMGFWSVGASVGQLLGPTLAGFLVLAFSWHAIFWVNVPVAIVVFCLVGLGVRALPVEPRKAGFDYLGAASFASGMLCLLVALTLLRVEGPGYPLIPFLAVAGVGLIVFFLRWELRHHAPVVDLSLFRNRVFSALILADAFRSFALFATVWLLPIFFQEVQGHTPLESGLLILPQSLALLIAAPSGGMLADRFGGRRVALIGLSLLTLSFGLLIGLDPLTTVLYSSVSLALCGFAQGFAQSPLVSSMMNAAPPTKIGAVSGLFTMMRFTVGTIGTTSMGLLLQGLIDRNLAAGMDTTQATVSGMHVVFACTAAMALGSLLVVAFGWRAAARRQARALAV